MKQLSKTFALLAFSTILCTACSNKRYPNSDTVRANPENKKYEPIRDRVDPQDVENNTPGHQNRSIRKTTPAPVR